MEIHNNGITGQRDRSQLISDLTTEYLTGKFSEDGEWLGGIFSPGLRDKLFFSIAFLRSGRQDAIKLANKILKKIDYCFCHFSPMLSIQLLVKYPELLDEDVRTGLTNYAEEMLDKFLGSGLDFIGVNDNFPCMAAFVSLIGGERFHKPELYARGKERLDQLKGLFWRRGLASEYNSPTYSAVQLLAIAEIANLTGDEEARGLALRCEERLWADLLGHLHRETSQTAGPYSRAYTVDSTGHTHQSRYALYVLLGEELPVNVRNTLFLSEEGHEGEVLHQNIPFQQISAAWVADTVYHCPEHLVELALNKKYPYEFIATTEYSSSTDAASDQPAGDPAFEEDTYEYPAGCARVSTYMTEDYAVGVATNEFHNGVQTDLFHIIYRKNAPAVFQKDIATVYCRYIINERQPELTSFSFEDEGRKIGLQEKNTAMVLYKPRISRRHGVSSMKCSVILPAPYGKVEEIWLGETRLEKKCGESREPCSVYVKDGPVYMAFHPAILTDLGRKAAVRIENIDQFILISFYNYEGSARDFAARGFLLAGNGFAAEIGSRAEAGSFEAFRKQMGAYQIKDVLQASVHTRHTFTRKTSYAREGIVLECEYSPVSEGIKTMAVNGKALEQPKFHITGFDEGRLPFMY